jgi:hypothetical protein
MTGALCAQAIERDAVRVRILLSRQAAQERPDTAGHQDVAALGRGNRQQVTVRLSAA